MARLATRGLGTRSAVTRRLGCRLLLALAATFVALATAAAGSWAATGHGLLSSFSSAAAGSLVSPAAVAVDRSSGDVFVADPGAGFVDVFDSGGSFLTRLGEGSLLASGVAVNESTGLVFVADSFENAVLVFAPDGKGGYAQVGVWPGEALAGGDFGEVTGVAVDNSAGPSAGDVYVVDAEDAKLLAGVVDVFKPKPAGPEEGSEGELVRVLSKGKMEEPNGVAVDPASGRVLVADSVTGSVLEFSASGSFEGKLSGSTSPIGAFGKEEDEGNVSAVAVDPVSGDLLVAEGEAGVVSEFNGAGTWVGWIPSTQTAPLAEPRGVAVASSGNVYVGDSALARVDVYGPGVVVPDASTGKASKLTRTTAILSGTLNGLGKPGHWFFQWGTTPALGSSTTPTAFSGVEEAVTPTLAELHSSTTYFFRLAAENENGTSYGAIRQFTTPTAVEGLSTGPVDGARVRKRDAHGDRSPRTGSTRTTTSNGARRQPTGTRAQNPPAPTPAPAKKPSTPRRASTGSRPTRSTTTGSSAKTSSAPPSVPTRNSRPPGRPRITSKPVTGIGHETATLNAEVNADELATTYHFEYGETTSYGTETPPGGASIGEGANPVPVTASLTALKLGVTYHYRVIASNSDGTTTGPDQTFTTIPPALITTWATSVKPPKRRLNATINPLGHDTTYYFQYGTEPCEPHPEACTSIPAPPGQDIGAGEEASRRAASNSADSRPDTTYHYRVLAINSLGTSEGPEHTITTAKPVEAPSRCPTTAPGRWSRRPTSTARRSKR